jgi:glycyl-tRNA synthetase
MSDQSNSLRSLAKRRGFFHLTAENHGGEAGFWSYGPEGAAVKRRIEDAWRDRFVIKEGNVEIEAPTVMGESVFEASGHLGGFDDMLVKCAECNNPERADHLVEDSPHTELVEAESLPNERVEAIIAEHDIPCPKCGTSFAGQPVINHNLMFETQIGPGDSNPGYLRPETAQGIFTDFHRLKRYENGQLPFGVAQIGRAFRNEINPRGGLQRLREFTQAELEFFIDRENDVPDLDAVRDVSLTLYPIAEQNDSDGEPFDTTIGEAVDEGVIADPWIAYFIGRGKRWYTRIGVDPDRLRFRQHQEDERAHYASDCWDAEAEIDGSWIEITGYADRASYDLEKHQHHTGQDQAYQVFRNFDESITTVETTVDPDMSVLGPEYGSQADAVKSALEQKAETDPEAFEGDEVLIEVDGETHAIPVELTGFDRSEVIKEGEHIWPTIIEPSFGIDRIAYSVLHHAFTRDEVAESDDERTFMALDPEVAPTLAGVFPLRESVSDQAKSLADELQAQGIAVEFDDGGTIGRRYRRQDEVGTPFSITVDPDGVTEGSIDRVTLRDRDSTTQVWIPTDSLASVLQELRTGATEFSELLDNYSVRSNDD